MTPPSEPTYAAGCRMPSDRSITVADATSRADAEIRNDRFVGSVAVHQERRCGVSDIVLPWPPASLSGHNKGHWRARNAIISQHRDWARNATLAAKPAVPETGDIRLIVAFYPPNRRGDRLNYSNRAKPYFDGIADALKVNDRRFVPSYVYGEPTKGGKVVIAIEAALP